MDTETLKTYEYLLNNASSQEKDVIFNKLFVKIKRGQLVTSRKILANNLNLTDRKVRTILKLLQYVRKIDMETTNKYSIITVCNYT